MDSNDDDSDDDIPTLQCLDEPADINGNGALLAGGEDDDDEIPTLQNLDETIQQQHEFKFNESANTTTKEDDLPPVPVTILTGFLGSGKTTLVRHILTSPQHQKRIAVIENEFGGGLNNESDASLAERMGLTVNDVSTLSVETMIVKDGTTDGLSSLADFIELSNGCVCCTVKDSLVETLESLLAKRTDLDYVIIEASGMADPGPVASIFWLDEALGSRIRLDGIVTCVDAKNICFQLESTSSIAALQGSSKDDYPSMPDGGGGDEAARQIAFADRIIVNKVDLLQSHQSPEDKSASTSTIESVLEQIKSINPTAPIKTTTYSKIEDLDWILDANCFDAERVKDVDSAFQQSMIDNSSVTMEGMSSLAQQHVPILYNGGSCNNPLCTEIHNAPNDVMLCGPCAIPSSPSLDKNTHHQHTSAVGTIALFGIGSVDLHKINLWLASILWPDQDESDKVLRARLEGLELPSGEAPESKNNDDAKKNSHSRKTKQKIYRVKGILSVKHAIDRMGKIIPSSNDWVDDGLADGFVVSLSSGSGVDGLDKRRFIVQAVNDLWDVLPASQNLCWDSNETRCCKIVVIGKWLDESQLQERFQECFNT